LTHIDPNGRAGHHIVPQFLWAKTDISPEARTVLNKFTLDLEGHVMSKAHVQYNGIAREIWTNYVSDNSSRFIRDGKTTLAEMTERDAIEITKRFARDERILKLLPELVEAGAKQVAKGTLKSEMATAAEKLALEKAATTTLAETGLKKTLGVVLGTFASLLGEIFFAEEFAAPPCPPQGCSATGNQFGPDGSKKSRNRDDIR